MSTAEMGKTPESKPASRQAQEAAGGWNGKTIAMVVALVLVGEFTYMCYAFPSAVLEQISARFQTAQTAWVLSAFTLASASLAPFLGRLADRIGKRRVMLITIASGVAGCFITAFAPSFAFVVVGRVFSGVTLGLAFMTSSLVRDLFPERIRPIAIGISTSGSGVVSIFTSLALSPIISAFGWQGVFIFPGIFGVAAGMLLVILVPESPARHRGGAFDFTGAVLIAVALTAILIPISQSAAWGWGAPQTVALLAAGGGLLAAWIGWELRAASPLIAVREFGYLPLMVALLVGTLGLCTTTSIFSFWSYIIAAKPSAGLGYGLGLPPSDVSNFTALYSVGLLAAGFITGWALGRFRPGSVMITAYVLMGAAYVFVSLFALTSAALFGIAVVVIGFGGGSTYATMYNLVAQTVPPHRQASAAAAVAAGGNVGGAVLPVVVFTILNAQAARASGVPVYSGHLIRVGLAFPACLSAVLVLAGIALLVFQKRHGNVLRPIE